MMVSATAKGFQPGFSLALRLFGVIWLFVVAVYARRALKPLALSLTDSGLLFIVDRHHSTNGCVWPCVCVFVFAASSWEMLGTNLSKKNAAGEWTTESERLLMMDMKVNNTLRCAVTADFLVAGFQSSWTWHG